MVTRLDLDLFGRAADALRGEQLLDEGELPRLHEVLGPWDGRSGSSGHVKERVGRRLFLAAPLDKVHDLRSKHPGLRLRQHAPEVSARSVPELVGVDLHYPI